MTRLSNLFAAQGIGSTNKFFAKARLQLAILYTIVFGTLVIILSAVMYHLFAADIHEDMAAVFPDQSEQVRIINYHKKELLKVMVLLNGGILIFIAGVSYLIAGKTLKPIQDNYEAQKRFIADASHDLRTPLAVLTADLEVSLDSGKLSKETKHTYLSYLEEVTSMKNVVEDLLMLFRFDSHQLLLTHENIVLNTFIVKSVHTMEKFARKNNVTLKILNVPKCSVVGDASLLQTAFRNLLKNAIEYSDDHGVVTISISKSNKMARIDINNGGIPIRAAEVTKVFKRSYRTTESQLHRKDGTGLGLPIAKEIIENHRGHLRIQSNKEQGTTVTILLPQL